MDLITTLTSKTLDKALDGLSLRNKAITSNLANVETPNYRRREVSFEGSLAQALESARGKQSNTASNSQPLPMRATQSAHIALNARATSVDEVTPSITENGSTQVRKDGNAVDLEYEMAQLAETTERYTALSKIAGEKFQGLKTLIQGIEG